MHAPLPGGIPAPSESSTSPQSLVTAPGTRAAGGRGRRRPHLTIRTPDPDEALRCRAAYADRLARVMPAAGTRGPIHPLEELA